MTWKRWSLEAFWVAVGQAISAMGALVGVRLLTTLLSPEMYGELALCVSLSMFVVHLAGESFAEMTMRFFAPLREKSCLSDFYFGATRFFFKIMRIVAVCSGVLLLILLAFGSTKLILIAVPTLLFAGLNTANYFIEGIRNGARNRKVVAFHQALFQWLRFLFAAVLIWVFKGSSITALWGFVLAAAIVITSQTFFFRRTDYYNAMRQPPSPSAMSVAREMRAYARPFLMVGGITWVFSFADRWTLNFISTLEDVGFYAALYQVGYFPVVFASKILLQLISPIQFEHLGAELDPNLTKRIQRWNRILTFVVLGFSCFVWFILFLYHDIVFSVFVAHHYREVSYLFPWVVLSAGIYAAGQIPLMYVMSFYESGRIMKLKTITMICGILLYMAGAFFYGLPGLVAGSLGFSVVYFVLSLRLLSDTENRRNLGAGVESINQS